MDIGLQVEQKREDMLSNRFSAVSTDITNCDTSLPGGIEINIIDSGGHNLNQFQVRSGLHFRLTNDNFICQDDSGIRNAGSGFRRLCDRVIDNVPERFQSRQIHVTPVGCITVKENDGVTHGPELG